MVSTQELFRQHRLRCTRQRVALYDALRQAMDHPTAEELYRRVAPDTDGLSRATVYNTLEALCKAGLARQMPGTNGCCRYDADTTQHLHFLCRQTCAIRDIPPDLGKKLLERLPKQVLAEIEAKLNVRIENVNIQLLGRSEG